MNKRFTLLFIAVAAMLLVACGGGGASNVGTEENPLIWALVPSQDTDAVLAGAEEIASYVEEQTGYVI